MFLVTETLYNNYINLSLQQNFSVLMLKTVFDAYSKKSKINNVNKIYKMK